jgi:hypothetical protein
MKLRPTYFVSVLDVNGTQETGNTNKILVK